MLSSTDKQDLYFAMKASLIENSNGVVQESYIKQELTYEQMLNLCFNHDKTTLMESSDLEPIAMISILNVITEAKSKSSKISLDKIKIDRPKLDMIKLDRPSLKQTAAVHDVGRVLSKKLSGKKLGMASMVVALTGVSAWYLYRKLRKQGIDKKTAAQAAHKVAERKAKKTGLKKDKDTADRWKARARRSSK